MDDKIISKGHLDVGDGHKIYYEEWGNPKSHPIIHLHGGPGAGFSSSHKRIYDPKKHHVIFHDQRGAGKSTPFASTENNTTQKLTADIVKLRNHLNVTVPTYIVGGSWGSTLSLLFTIAHPELVKGLLMWGIALVRLHEHDMTFNGEAGRFFPEAWERFIGLVPPSERKSPMDVMSYYRRKLHDTNFETAKRHANEWILWELTLCSILYEPQKLEEEVMSWDNLAFARLEAHYYVTNFFMPENYILKNIGKISHIPATVIQGRFDFCTRPINAYELAKAYGKNLKLQYVNSGHLRSEPIMLDALRATANALLV